MKNHRFSRKTISLFVLMVTGIYSYSSFAYHDGALDNIIERINKTQEYADKAYKALGYDLNINKKLKKPEIKIKKEIEELIAHHKNSLINSDNSDALEVTNNRFSIKELGRIQRKLNKATYRKSKLYFLEEEEERGHYRYFLTNQQVYRMCHYCPTDRKGVVWPHTSNDDLFNHSCFKNYASPENLTSNDSYKQLTWRDKILPRKEKDKNLLPFCRFPEHSWISLHSDESIDNLIDKLIPSCKKDELISQHEDSGSNKKICSKGLTHNEYEVYTQCVIIGPDETQDVYMRCNEKLEWSVKKGSDATSLIESLANHE